jgi:hypothetical protein
MVKKLRHSNRDIIIELLKDPDRKPVYQIFSECLYLLFTYREMPVHYISRYLFKKQVTNIKDYIPNNMLGKIPSRFNDQKAKEVLDNKLYFDLFFAQFDIPTPKILMYNHRNTFIVGNKVVVINNINDFKIILEDIFRNHPAFASIIIKKTYASSSGNKIYKLFRYINDIDPTIIEQLYSEVIKSEFLFQETIKQHHVLNELNSSCLNTIRIDTFIDSEGKIDIISAYLRLSISNCHVDNISSGGCGVGVDIQTGKLKKYGYGLIQTCGMEIFTEHPLTKVIFEDFTIPFFTQVKELVVKAASLVPVLRLVGWDVAIGESGPILIEGNSDYDTSGNDLADEGYRSNTVYRKVLKEIKYL